MTTPDALRFIDKLHALETFATEHPELVGSQGEDEDMTQCLDELKRHADARVVAFDRLASGTASELCRALGTLDVVAAIKARNVNDGAQSKPVVACTAERPPTHVYDTRTLRVLGRD